MSISLLHDDSRAKISKACTRKVDRISDLPDDILVSIMSLITLKEAGSTSVLSKRWRLVWAFLPNLNFDASELLDEMRTSQQFSGRKRFAQEAKYFRWVDQVVNSHLAPTIDEFRVQFNFRMDKNTRFNNFDNWLRFAMEKRVKRLEFNVLALCDFCSLPYALPSLLPSSRLTSLELVHVDVTGEILQKFLSDCPDLERLSVRNAVSLEDLKVVDPPKLKYFKLWHCSAMKHLEISAPKLTELCVHGRIATDLFCNFSDLSSFLSQLEVFSLHKIRSIAGRVPKEYPVASRLKMLLIQLEVKTAAGLFDLIYMIKSCPVLHKLELQLITYAKRNIKMTDETRGAEVFRHDKLKILKMSGFAGCGADTEFAIYLINTFVSVEKITIEVYPVEPISLRAVKEAQKLFAVVDPRTELEIICPEKRSMIQ